MGADVGTFGRRSDVSVGVFERRTGVEVGAFYWKWSGEGGVFGRVAVAAGESSERTGEVVEACVRKLTEGEGEAWEKSSAVEGEVAAKGMKTTVEGAVEGSRRWAEVGEAARHLHLCPRWLRRNTGSPFSRGGSGNRGTEPRCPGAVGPPGVCRPICQRPSCVR